MTINESNKSHHKYEFWVDFVRAFATIAVIVLHSSAPILYRYNLLPLSHWWGGNIINASVRMCVPLFFMISGYLLLPKTEALSSFFRKRVTKVVIPLIVWTIFYSLFIWKVPMNIYLSQTFQPSISSYLDLVFSPVIYHLWFLYVLIGVYAVVPILRLVIRNLAKKTVYYIVWIWLFYASSMAAFLFFTDRYDQLDLRIIFGYGGLFLAGVVLGTINPSKKLMISAFIISIICIGFGAYGTYYITKPQGLLGGYFLEYLSPNVILLSFSSFVILKYFGQKIGESNSQKLKQVIKTISIASFGIYLVHIFILYFFGVSNSWIYLNVLESNPLISTFMVSLLTFMISFGLVLIMKKIPIVKESVP